MPVVEAVGPLDRPRSEDERSTRRLVLAEAVRHRPRAAFVEDAVDAVGARRHVELARRPERIVRVDVPLVSERAGRKRVRLAASDARVPPEALVLVACRHGDRVLIGEGSLVELAAKPVLRAGAVVRWAAARIAPVARPHVRRLIDLRACGRLLVADERAVGLVRAVDRVRPACLPEHLVAAEERKVDTGVTRRLDVRPLLGRPILVMTDGEERFMP